MACWILQKKKKKPNKVWCFFFLLVCVCYIEMCNVTEIHINISLPYFFFFAFSYCSWCSQGRNTEVVCHSFLQQRFLRVPWTARRSNQSILMEINPEYSLEGLMLKLKLQYFGHLIRRTDSLEKTLMMGKIEGRKRRG